MPHVFWISTLLFPDIIVKHKSTHCSVLLVGQNHSMRFGPEARKNIFDRSSHHHLQTCLTLTLERKHPTPQSHICLASIKRKDIQKDAQTGPNYCSPSGIEQTAEGDRSKQWVALMLPRLIKKHHQVKWGELTKPADAGRVCEVLGNVCDGYSQHHLLNLPALQWHESLTGTLWEHVDPPQHTKCSQQWRGSTAKDKRL